MSVFSISDLSLRFGGVQAIGNVSFSVEQGEVFAIIGPNGAGKTSILNVITRVFDPTQGRVLFEGQDITALPRHKVVHSGIGRTFQNIELFEGGTVMDNLLLGRHRFPHGSFAAQWLWTPAVRAAEAASTAPSPKSSRSAASCEATKRATSAAAGSRSSAARLWPLARLRRETARRWIM